MSNLVVMEHDLSQGELRVAASLSHDKSMIKVFDEDGDIHLDTSLMLWPKTWYSFDEAEQKRLRVLAKTCSFGLLYGLGDKGLVKYCMENDPPVYITLQEARRIRSTVLGGRIELNQWLENTREFAMKNGYTQNLFNQRRYFPDLKSKDEYVVEDNLKAAINMPIQGTLAVIVKAIMIEVEKKFPGYMRLQVHDSLFGYVLLEKVKEIGDAIQKIMVDTA